jgi:hypothetical protein
VSEWDESAQGQASPAGGRGRAAGPQGARPQDPEAGQGAPRLLHTQTPQSDGERVSE